MKYAHLTFDTHPYFSNQTTENLYSDEGMNMVHAPVNPYKTFPRVSNVNQHEKWRYNVIRHLRWFQRNLAILPLAIYEYATSKPIKVPDDTTFANLFTDTMLCRVLSQEFEAEDHEIFKEWLGQAKPEDSYYKIDCRFMSKATPGEEFYVAPTVALLKQVGEMKLELLAININDICVTPEDGHAWDLAKITVMQNVNYATTNGTHTLLHFPMDPMNFFTLQLPKSHVLRQLLEPHLVLQLRINDAVRFSPASVKCPAQDKIYSPYYGDTRSLPMVAYSGSEEHNFKPYQFVIGAPELPFNYGQFLKTYHKVFYDFVKQVVLHIDKNDPLVVEWADEIAKWTPGFPDGQHIFKGDNLTAVLTTFLFDVTVEHAADHVSYAQIPTEYLPLRMRIEPPKSKNIPAFDPRDIRNKKDALQHRLAWALFFSPSNISLLQNTKYPFKKTELKQAARDFIHALKQTDKEIRKLDPQLPALKTISRSIQY